MSTTIVETSLDARSIVEASAGTGKTYALAGLFARAVIVRRLQVPQILAVTYTVAATQELHERVRLRLQRAVQLADAWRPGDPAEVDGDNAETALLRGLLHEALSDPENESLFAMQLRLRRAVRDLDLAAINTIHQFCLRLLSEHALLARQPLLGMAIEPGNRAQRQRIAIAVWRGIARTPEGADFLARTFGSLGELANAIRHLLAQEPLLPPNPPGDASADRDAAWREVRTVYAHEGQASRDALDSAVARRVLSGAKDKRVPEELWAWFAEQSDAPPHPVDTLARLTRDSLRKACLKNMESLVPNLALSDAVERYLVAYEACDVQRLHALKEAVHLHDRAEKEAAHVRDFDDLVEDVHRALQNSAARDALTNALRGQFPLVLVDEFQDTDARQWDIFSTLFGVGGLLLVGDPKQAIYRFRGGDVETYLAARDTANLAAPLDHNFRSRPSVLAAVNGLFEHATRREPNLLGEGISFTPTHAGAGIRDDDLRDGDSVSSALVVQELPRRADGKDWNKPESIKKCAQRCAIDIRDRLRAAHAGQATRRDGGARRPLQPRDFAVLVRTHEEGVAVRDALLRLGVPAVSAGRNSLYDTPEARQLLALLTALAAPGDDRRLRAVLATPLFGYDAQALQALEGDGDAQQAWQQDLAEWRLRWETHGPQPMLADVLAREAARMLTATGGERQLTNLGQLGEQLQEVRASRLGPQAQLDWLQGAIAQADREDETQWPNLESDASRVQILTLHTSKGLEFPLVYLPFASIGRGGTSQPDFVGYHDANGRRVRQWKTRQVHPGAPPWKQACEASRIEEAAEDMRLLYVGLTRARDALWTCFGPSASHESSALSRLFGGVVPEGDSIVVRAPSNAADEDFERLAPTLPEALPPARIAERRLRRDWWIHSFSQLHRQHAHGLQALADEAPADDERPLAPIDPQEAVAPRFAGTRFGNALHHALEHVAFAEWRDLDGSTIDAKQHAILCDALRSQDYPESDFDAGAAELAPLIARTLNAPLPEGVRLADVDDAARVAELEFHFTLADADVPALLALLQAHGIATGRRDFGAWPRLSGLMTGKIDLTYRVDGRVYVIDYKSNRLPGWDAASLAQAMSASEYDLQALLYAVAVHRWLRMRLGSREAATQAFGGVRYLFCRGLDAGDPARGVAIPALSPELIHAVDDLLGGAA